MMEQVPLSLVLACSVLVVVVVGMYLYHEENHSF